MSPRTTTSLAIALAVAASPTTFADVKAWNAASGFWASGGNWSPVGVPGPGDVVFIGNSALAENAFVTLNSNANVGTVSITDGMTLDSELAQLTVVGGIGVSGQNDVPGISYPSRLRVANGPNAVDVLAGSVNVTSNAALELDGGTLQSIGPIDLAPETTLYGRGAIQLLGATTPSLRMDCSLQVAPGSLVITQVGAGRIDLDGTFGLEDSIDLGTIHVNPFQAAHLTINGSGLADAMDDHITMAHGSSLTMNLAEGWTLGAGASISLSAFGASYVSANVLGSPLLVKGTLEASGLAAWLIVHAARCSIRARSVSPTSRIRSRSIRHRSTAACSRRSWAA